MDAEYERLLREVKTRNKVIRLSDLNREIEKICCQSNRYSAYEMLGRLPVYDVSELAQKTAAHAKERTVGIRWFSQMNEWMDCLILVPSSKAELATAAVRKGIDTFWSDDNQEAYGDCIEHELRKKAIPYVIEYETANDYVDDEAWEHHLDQYVSVGIEITNA